MDDKDQLIPTVPLCVYEAMEYRLKRIARDVAIGWGVTVLSLAGVLVWTLL